MQRLLHLTALTLLVLGTLTGATRIFNLAPPAQPLVADPRWLLHSQPK
jgi:hypothetical protein